MDHSLKTIKTASTVTEKKYDLIKLLSFQFQFLLLPQKKDLQNPYDSLTPYAEQNP